MKSIFLVWKDKNCNGENPEWIHMTAKEFFEFKQKPENSERKFVQVEDKNLSSKYSVIFIEVIKSCIKNAMPNTAKICAEKRKRKNTRANLYPWTSCGAMTRTQITTKGIRITGGRKNIYWTSSKLRNCIRR